MSEENDGAEKSFEPTQKRLDDARLKGEVPRSADITTAAAYLGFVVMAVGFGATSLLGLSEILTILLDQSDSLSETVFEGAGAPLAGGMLFAVAGSMLPWFLIPGGLALLSELAQQSFVFAPQKLVPKASRISPISAIKNKLGLSGLVEFAKSLTKLLLYGAALSIFLVRKIDDVLGMATLSPGMVTAQLLRLTLEMVLVVLIIASALGLIDLVWQRTEYIRKHRMTRQEVIDEMKESEGDPGIRQHRRQRAVTIAMNQMLADVPAATVVVVNPTHYAVALKWDKRGTSAPICVAKGADEIAARIRVLATEHGVPIQSDPPTARALFAEVDVGQEIGRNHYRAVAAAIRFAEQIRKKVRMT